MADKTLNVLLVEDSPSDGRLIQTELRTIEGGGLEITWVMRLDEAISELSSRGFDVCLLDLSLPDSSGMETFFRLRLASPELPVVVLTGQEDDAAGINAIRQGVQDYLTKGSDNGRAVARAIRYAIERKRSAEELQASRRAALNLAEDAVAARQDAEKINADLLRSREEWVETFNVIPDQIAILDTDHIIVRANKALADALGVSVPEIMGQPCFRCVHDAHAPLSACPHSLMLNDGAQHIAEINDRRLGKDFLVSVTPILDKTGAVKGSVHVARDVTEAKKREKELVRLNRTLTALGKSSQAMMRAADETEYMNEVCRIVVEDCGHAMVWIGFAQHDEKKTVRPVAFSGFEAGYLETLNITWADNERGSGPTGTAIRTAKQSECKNMLVDPDFAPWRDEAARRGFAASIAFPLTADNNAFGAISIYSKEPDPFSENEKKLLSELADDLAQGITSIRLKKAQALAEEALSEERNFVKAVLQTTGGLIVGLDLEGRIRIFNHACEKTTGFRAEEVMGRKFWDFLLDPDEAEQVKAVFSGIVDGSIPRESENENYWIAKDGSRRFIRWANTALLRDDGAIEMIIGTGIDITERKTMEELINLKNVELAAANKELDAFSYSVSHDLRSPLHVITGFADLLIKEYKAALDDRGIDFVKTLKGEVERMNALIADMLHLSRITRQEMTRTEVDLSRCAEGILKELAEASPGRSVTTAVGPGIRCMADERLIYILLQNLLGNAWKFTKNRDDPRIEFGETEAQRGCRTFFVRDNGAGFAMDQAGRLFNPFQRLHPQEEFEGTGIGLAIVKRVVSRHGGTVRASSDKGKGATFFFTLE